MVYILGIFIILHGMVHLLYAGHCARIFTLKPGMDWPDGSWAWSKLLGNEAARKLASISLILAAAGFIAGGAGVIFDQAWWPPVVMGTALLSSLVYILFWNGRKENLDGQGAVGILINLAILIAVILFR